MQIFIIFYTHENKKDVIMKKILLGAAIAAASIFTACDSSSESSSVTSCTIKALGVQYACMESSDAAINDMCNSIKDESMGLGEGILGSGCPGGAVKTCNGTSEGITGTAYFYSSDAADATCEELLSDDDDFDEEDDYGFTPDDPEYYMKALKKAAK